MLPGYYSNTKRKNRLMRRVSFPVPYLIQIVSMWPTGHRRTSSTLQVKALRQVQIHTEAESAKCLDQTKILLLFFWLQFARWSGGSEDQLVVAFDSAGKHACRSLVSQWNLARCLVSAVDTTLQPMQLTRLTQAQLTCSCTRQSLPKLTTSDCNQQTRFILS